MAHGELPALFVGHTEDNSWLVGDGVTDPAAEGAVAAMCIWSAVGLDASLRELADLPIGWAADRDAVGDPWVRTPFQQAG